MCFLNVNDISENWFKVNIQRWCAYTNSNYILTVKGNAEMSEMQKANTRLLGRDKRCQDGKTKSTSYGIPVASLLNPRKLTPAVALGWLHQPRGNQSGVIEGAFNSSMTPTPAVAQTCSKLS